MSKKLFTAEEIKLLSKNKYVKNITTKGITYKEEFKRIFISENTKGELPRQIFEKCRFDVDIVGMNRVCSAGKRWRKSELYIAISNTVKKYKLKNMISHLCKVVGVSRSVFYKYFSKESIAIRKLKDIEDEIIKEHIVLPNILNREFKQEIAKKVLLTDITYLPYSNGKRAYLSTVKDSCKNEILAHNLVSSLKIDIVLDTIDILIKNTGGSLHKDVFIHSYQGVHYTRPKFQKKVKSVGIGQSMSRRVNCWNNAPQQSFFGNFKDEVDFENCNSLDDVRKEVDEYVDYYNNYRYQWNLNKMTPTQYRDHLLVA